MIKRLPWIEISLIVFYLTIHILLASGPAENVLKWYESDDAFYYYKVAVNITSGRGVTFDGMSVTNGFHPLWMLVCIMVFWLARFNLVLPLRVMILISAALQAGGGWLLFRLLQRGLSAPLAALGAVLWIFSSTINVAVVQNGLESGISGFFLILLLYLAVNWEREALSIRRSVILGVVAGLTVLARLDNIFVVLLLGVWFVLGNASAYLRMVATGDLGIIFIAGLLSYFIRLRVGPFYFNHAQSLPWLLILAYLTLLPALFLAGMYRLRREEPIWKLFWRGSIAISIACSATGAVLMTLPKIGVYPVFPRSIIIIFWVGMLLGLLTLRLLAWQMYGKAHYEAAANADIYHKEFWKPFLSRAASYYVPVGGMLLSYMAINYIYAGTFMPISGQVKHWWGHLHNVAYGALSKDVDKLLGANSGWSLALWPVNMLKNLLAHLFSPGAAFLVALLVLLSLVLVFVFLQSEKFSGLVDQFALFPLFIGLYAHVFYYTSTGYLHTRSWYWVGEMLLAVVGWVCWGELIHQTLAGRRWATIAWSAAVVVVGLSVMGFYTVRTWGSFLMQPQEAVYEPLEEVRQLEENTEPGSLIGMTGSGFVGYFIEGRTIVNLDGLINSPDYFENLRKGYAAHHLAGMGVKYIFGNKYVLTSSDPYQGAFAGHLQWLMTIGENQLYRFLP